MSCGELAWQDVLLEKRWLDIDEQLTAVKDRVLENVSEDVVQYLRKLRKVFRY